MTRKTSHRKYQEWSLEIDVALSSHHRHKNNKHDKTHHHKHEVRIRQQVKIKESVERKWQNHAERHSPKEKIQASPGEHLRLCMQAANKPHPEKAAKGGDDAYFLDKCSFGVFDGVGSWADQGVDVGLYSRKLGELTRKYVRHHGPGAIVDALKYAAAKNNETGSSTACVAALHGRHLVGVNVGDSKLVLIRGGDIVFGTSTQQHAFNCPYQLGTGSNETVEDGDRFDITVRPGDLLVAASDGLWDNVPQDQIVAELLYRIRKYKSRDNTGCLPTRENVAMELAKIARRFSELRDWMSPFAKAARRAGIKAKGGKIDDVTVIVVMVRLGTHNCPH